MSCNQSNMYKFHTGIFCLFISISIISKAQYKDSAYSFSSSRYHINTVNLHVRTFYIPAALIALGSYSNNGEAIINNEAIKAERDETMPHFRTHVDDYMQYAGIFAGYGCLMSGSKTNAWVYTKEVALNEAIMCFSVNSVKRLSKVPSIVNGSYTAFPSGHTAQAFSAATLFNDNFAKGKPWLQCLSYSSASAVGVLRVLNERHWAGDVVAGAGFGILSAKISEWVVTSQFNKKHSVIINP